MFCDKTEDVTNQYPDELHAGFALSSYQESVVLSNRAGRCIDAVDYENIPADSSYARTEGGSWEINAKPTPGFANTDEGYTQFQQTLSAAFASAKVYLSEAMTSNASLAEDSAGEFNDWIELCNRSDQTVDLTGWGLSDNTKNPYKWVFPEGTAIEPGEYLVIQASGKNAVDEKKNIHTSFRLASAGESVILTDSQGKLTDRLSVGRLRDGMSYGKSAEGLPLYYQTPTPGSANGQGYPSVARSPVISLAAGFYWGTQQVTLEIPEGASVYYTTDGSEPTEKSRKYAAGESIEVSATGPIRARAYVDGLLPSTIATSSYVINNPHSDQLSIICISTNYDWLFDEEDGIYVTGVGKTIESRDANFNKEIEIPAHVEIFDPQGNLQVSQELALRMFGAFSRRREQKGFALIARNIYGSNTIDYPLFENRDYDSYHSVILRAGGQDSTVTKLHDIVATNLVDGTTNLEVQAYRQCVLYIDGEYFGIYNLREKVNKHWVAQHYGYDPENIDLLVGNGSVLQGSNKEYKELIEWCSNTNFKSDENYAQLAAKIDIDNYIDYLISQMWVANTDTGNIKFFRERSSDPERSKWKWIYYDFCWSFISTQRDSVSKLSNPDGHGVGQGFSTQLTRSCFQNAGFVDQFLRRAAELFNTVYSVDNVMRVIEETEGRILEEKERDSARWPEGGALRVWNSNVSHMKEFAQNRTGYMIYYLRKYFNLSDSKCMEYFGSLGTTPD